MKKIAVGSYPFFHMYEDYDSHDRDYVVFENGAASFKNYMNVRLFKQKTDTYYFRDVPKDDMLRSELKRMENVPMAINKFLVPEVCKYKGITLEDLKPFEHLFDKMDERHKYLEIIYRSYVENGGFFLTKQQRDNAYREYKNKRK